MPHPSQEMFVRFRASGSGSAQATSSTSYPIDLRNRRPAGAQPSYSGRLAITYRARRTLYRA
jgi:hypothetical protein